MRVVPRLLAALTIAGLLIPMGAAPVMAVEDANFDVHPDEGPVGEEVYLEGECDDNDEGWVYFELIPGEDEWIKVLDDSDDWDFNKEIVNEGEPSEYEYDAVTTV